MKILAKLFRDRNGPSSLLSKARKAERNNDKPEALKLYDEILKRFPASSEARQAKIGASEIRKKQEDGDAFKNRAQPGSLDQESGERHNRIPATSISGSRIKGVKVILESDIGSLFGAAIFAPPAGLIPSIDQELASSGYIGLGDFSRYVSQNGLGESQTVSGLTDSERQKLARDLFPNDEWACCGRVTDMTRYNVIVAFHSTPIPKALQTKTGNIGHDMQNATRSPDTAKKDIAAVEKIIDELMRASAWYEKVNLAEQLGSLGDNRAIDALVFLLDTKEGNDSGGWECRHTACESLGKLRAVDALIKALSHRNTTVVYRSATELGKIGDKKAIDPLKAIAENHTDAEVRDAARGALHLLGASSKMSQLQLDDALLDAAYEGELSKVKSLLENGANPNAIGLFNSTPLSKALDNGDLAVAQLLRDRGAIER